MLIKFSYRHPVATMLLTIIIVSTKHQLLLAIPIAISKLMTSFDCHTENSCACWIFPHNFHKFCTSNKKKGSSCVCAINLCLFIVQNIARGKAIFFLLCATFFSLKALLFHQKTNSSFYFFCAIFINRFLLHLLPQFFYKQRRSTIMSRSENVDQHINYLSWLTGWIRWV